jgi:hypothetical protein
VANRLENLQGDFFFGGVRINFSFVYQSGQKYVCQYFMGFGGEKSDSAYPNPFG